MPKGGRDPSVAGVDIGGTRTKLAIIGRDGRVERTAVVPRPRASESDVLGTVVERLKGLRLEALGVALPGIVDSTFGPRDLPGKLPGLSGRPLVEELSARLGIRTVCLNDGQAATIGEWQAGAGRAYEDFVMVTLGTGVGSGVIMRGRPLAGGWLGVGNGVGHMSFEPDGEQCLCGNIGCPETRVSAPAIMAAARAHLARGVASTLASERRAITFERVVAAAASGDALATRIVDRFVCDLGVMLVSAAQAYGPSAIVLGGGMVAAFRGYLPRIQQYVEAHTWRYPRDRPLPVLAATLGEFSGAVGAAMAASEAVAEILDEGSGRDPGPRGVVIDGAPR